MSYVLGFNGLFRPLSATEDTNLSCPTRTIELKDNTVIVVLGASGDLAKKKTVREYLRRILGAFTNPCNSSSRPFLVS
jgi:hypothetical protein